ncbi:MAG: hypothetical protein KAI47_10245 [Deltaproteobacteria bacterium]|nr:hypothetical protein [Deltaproteobacteria bacterium]
MRHALISLSLSLPVVIAATAVTNAAPRSHLQVVSDVARMVSSGHAQGLARRHHLRFLNVLWEDTGRYKGSSVGPNISDVTIEVQAEDKRGHLRTRLMPVLRYPNFRDRTADIRADRFYLRIGNQRRGGQLSTISLATFLRHPLRYLSMPKKGQIKGGSLWAPRDKHVLVSAQATFLPVRRSGQTRFWPVIFNYQSTRRHPAVLTLLVTRQGTSVTVIDNSRDTGRRSRGQRLYFNKAGQRAPLLAERLSRVKARGVTANGESAASLGRDANLLLMVQIPLKVRRRRRHAGGLLGGGAGIGKGGLAMPMATKSCRTRRGMKGRSNVEVAVLGHGQAKGPFTELDGLTIARDRRFPVRVTVQFYQATSNGVVNQADVHRLSKQIASVYAKGDYVGSLVTSGPTGRPTEWKGAGRPPRYLTLDDFPGLRQRARRRGLYRRPERLPLRYF